MCICGNIKIYVCDSSAFEDRKESFFGRETHRCQRSTISFKRISILELGLMVALIRTRLLEPVGEQL